MSDFTAVTPLLDNLVAERTLSEHSGSICRLMKNTQTGERFVLKQLSIPASDCQIRALILSGAYPDEQAVHEYYSGVVESIKRELAIGKQLAAASAYAAAIGVQSIPKDTGIGHDVFILYPLYVPLSDLLAESAITSLRAFNLGMDICDALDACREAGYLFGNVKPENIYLMPNGRFLLGDLGLTSLEDLQYACVPEEYIGPYSAPELSEITASLNKTVDLYSLGMVLYRIYNGNHGPFEDEVADEAMAEKLRMTGKPLPTPIYADYELTSIILKACAFKPTDRFQSPAELKQALTLYMQRNEISDTLIIPPIVAAAPLAPEELAEEPTDAETAPIRMTDEQSLDSTFRESFAPDTSGGGSEEDIDLTAAPVAPVVQPPIAKPIETPAAPVVQPPIAAPVEEAAEESAPFDEDEQMDLDDLLASVSEVVGPAPQPDGQAQNTDGFTIRLEQSRDKQTPLDNQYVDGDEFTEPQSDTDEPKKKSRFRPGVLATLAALIIAIGAVAYFLFSWYFVDISQIRQVSANTRELVVELVTEDSLEHFLLKCTDTHGISYALTEQDGSLYTFGNLQEDTTYTISVSAVGSHKLRDAQSYSLDIRLPKSTVISELAAKRTASDTAARITFHHEGLEPKAGWQLIVEEPDTKQSNTYTFMGNSYDIEGLKENTPYIFTLVDTEDVFLSGECSIQYTLLPRVAIENLTVTNISETDVTISWESILNDPGEWLVSTDEADSTPISVTSTTCTVPIADFDRVNAITLSALGMDEDQQISLPANPIMVNNLSATANVDGSVTLLWETPAAQPDGGWLISYRPVGSIHDPLITDALTDTYFVLTELIPNAAYEIEIMPASGSVSASRLYGELKTSVKTTDLGAVTDYSITPAPPVTREGTHIALFDVPTEENWTNNDLLARHEDGLFGSGVPIIFLIQLESGAASDNEVLLQYVVRDADGNVCNDLSEKTVWDSLWDSTLRHSNEIPLHAECEKQAVSITAAGSYTFEVYINGRLLATIGFTIQ